MINPIYEKIEQSFSNLESTLRQSLHKVTELGDELKLLRCEAESYKFELYTQKEKCEKQRCSSSEALTKVVKTKECAMASIVSNLKMFLDTKDLNLIQEVFKLLCVEYTVLTPPKDNKENITPIKKEIPQPESVTFTMDVSMNDASLSEIEGTPTGRTSPIIQTRVKSSFSSLLNADSKEKKKCPENWPTPPKKAARTTSTPSRGKATRMRQQRLNLTKLRATTVVDLTSSPEFSGGMRRQKSDVSEFKPIVKQEYLENEDTILPSPTSATIFPPTLLRTSKDSPAKKKPSLKLKRESDENEKQLKCDGSLNNSNIMEDSINLLNQQPNRFKKPLFEIDKVDPDQTECDIPSSGSLLKNIEELELRENIKVENTTQVILNSPSKKPLAENINMVNTDNFEHEASMSLLRTDNVASISVMNNKERKTENQQLDPVFKDPTVRKKAEKRALPGWSCDECKIFYDELYRHDPDMLAKLMNECSKHRGRKNPARPKTPEGFWNPRWNVPEDTEEFNRRNNAA